MAILWRIATDGAARAESKRGYTMPSRDGGRQSQIRSYVTRGLQIPVNPNDIFTNKDRTMHACNARSTLS